MMDQLWTFIQTQLAHNQFLTGGFVLGTIAALAHQCRALPARFWNWLQTRVTIIVEIPDHDDAFKWINDWLALHPYGAHKARFLTVKTGREAARSVGECEPRNCGQPRIILSPSTGHHWFWYGRNFVMLERARKDRNAKDSWASAYVETFNIKMFTRKRSAVLKLLEEARDLFHPPNERRIDILCADYSGWVKTSSRRPRPIESVILRAGVMEELIERITWFRLNEQWYIDRGLPHRLGILLKGPPGSGKSSAVVGLASYFGADIATLSLNSGGMCDERARKRLADVPKDTFTLMEDVDCIFDQREASDNETVTFSGLLNAIDGVAAGEGRILFMTTNHPEKLDPALIRDGRADLKIEIAAPDSEQVGRIFLRFFPEASDDNKQRFVAAVDIALTSMAALQNHLVKYCRDVDAAITNAGSAIVTKEKAL